MKTANAATLRETSVYSCFAYNAEQRRVDSKQVKNLMESMSTFGFLPSKPVQVYKEGNKHIIIDGHHRYLAAKNLQIPVLYVVEPKSHQASMAAVNRLQKTWSLKNFVEMYAKRGLRPYLELMEYNRLGIPFLQAALMLRGNSSAGGSTRNGSAGKSVMDGSFKVVSREKIEVLAQFLRDHGHQNPAFKTANFIIAFEVCLRVKDFDHSQLTRKLGLNPRTITRTAGVDQMLDQFEEVYNYHQAIKTPLAFHAKEARRKAQPALKSKAA